VSEVSHASAGAHTVGLGSLVRLGTRRMGWRVNGQLVQIYPVALVVAPVGPEVPAQESGVGEAIVLREMMGVNDGTLTEVVRRGGPTKYLTLEVNLQNLGDL